jgi:hypothetical protein
MWTRSMLQLAENGTTSKRTDRRWRGSFSQSPAVLPGNFVQNIGDHEQIIVWYPNSWPKPELLAHSLEGKHPMVLL